MDKKIVIALSAFIVFMLGIAVYGAISTKNKDAEKIKSVLTDGKKFKEEYESLNGRVNENNGKLFLDLNIKEDNIVEYATAKEIIDIIENGTGVIYFGYESCPWCRAVVPILLNAMEEVGAETLYYLNVKDIRSRLELNGENKVITIKNGTNEYYKLLAALDSVLEPYTLETPKDKKGKTKKIDTGEKRLYVPTVVFVKNGEIIDAHVGTVSDQKDAYTALTKKQTEKLNKIFSDYIKEVVENCDEGEEC